MVGTRNTVVLPAPDVMNDRLCKTVNDVLLRQYLYPLLTVHGGQEKEVAEVALILHKAVLESLKHFPSRIAGRLPEFAERFIDVLVDRQMVERVKELYFSLQRTDGS